MSWDRVDRDKDVHQCGYAGVQQGALIVQRPCRSLDSCKVAPRYASVCVLAGEWLAGKPCHILDREMGVRLCGYAGATVVQRLLQRSWRKWDTCEGAGQSDAVGAGSVHWEW